MSEKRRDSKGRVLKENETQRDNGLYIFSYKDIYGLRKQVSSWKLVPTDRLPSGKRDCISLREKEESIREDLMSGINSSAKSKLTVNDLFNKYMESKSELKESTLGNYLFFYNKYVRDTFGKRKVADIKYSDVKLFYTGLLNGKALNRSKGLHLNSVSTIHTILHPLFTLAERDNIINKNPADNVMSEIKRSHAGETKKRTALTIEQQQAFLEFIGESATYRHWMPLMVFFLGTGCRIGEGLGITWKDIDFTNNTISINHSLSYRKELSTGKLKMHINTPKTKAGKRIIPMLGEVRNALLNIKTEQMKNTFNCIEIDGYRGFVFLNKNGHVYLPVTIFVAIKRIISAFNEQETVLAKTENRNPNLLPDFSAHILRHTFCTRFCENESNIKVIQEVMGHSDFKTTMDIYAEATEAKKKESFANMEGKIIPIRKVG